MASHSNLSLWAPVLATHPPWKCLRSSNQCSKSCTNTCWVRISSHTGLEESLEPGAVGNGPREDHGACCSCYLTGGPCRVGVAEGATEHSRLSRHPACPLRGGGGGEQHLARFGRGVEQRDLEEAVRLPHLRLLGALHPQQQQPACTVYRGGCCDLRSLGCCLN